MTKEGKEKGLQIDGYNYHSRIHISRISFVVTSVININHICPKR